ncbi:hypothetical protein M0R45_006437 [Rubus argutus]|uniref:Uncharacterized protein n=1 Tax=Rubus argutus TaxID=59490 RepID=A0AAW1YR29_RUBAR
MSYEVNGSFPYDKRLAQNLLLKGREPLPSHRFRPASQEEYTEPYLLPASLRTTRSDSSVVWTTYTCRNYNCLVNRKRNEKGFSDCKDCFDLQGTEKSHWASPKGGGLHFSIHED